MGVKREALDGKVLSIILSLRAISIWRMGFWWNAIIRPIFRNKASLRSEGSVV